MTRTILNRKPVTKDYSIILVALTKNGNANAYEFVTWQENNTTLDTYSGHYYGDLESAISDFNDRF